MNDGSNVKWRQLPSTSFSDTTYTLSNGDTTNTVKLTSSSGDAQTVTINNVAHASSADQASTATSVANSLTIKLDGGETEGTSKFTYDGSAAITIDVARSVHTHGHITNSGKIVVNRPIKDGDKIVITDSDNYILRSSVAFDGTTTTKALTPAGT